MILTLCWTKSQPLVGKPRASRKLSKRGRTPGSTSSMCAIPTALPSSSWNCRDNGRGGAPRRPDIAARWSLPQNRNRTARDVLVNDAAFHNENNAAHRRDVFERIAVERDDVGLVARRDGTDTLAHAHRFGGERVRGNHCAHRINAGIAHAIDELLGVATMRAGERVRAENDFESGNLNRAADDIVIERHGSLHRPEAFLGVALRAEEALLVSQVVLDYEPGLRIEICTVLGQNFEVVISCHRAVLDLGSASERGFSHRILI